MKLVNISCSSALTMAGSTHPMHLVSTCETKASITRLHHHTHLPRMENLNVYTEPSWTVRVPFDVTQTYPQTCGGKPWRQRVTWKTIHWLQCVSPIWISSKSRTRKFEIATSLLLIGYWLKCLDITYTQSIRGLLRNCGSTFLNFWKILFLFETIGIKY